MRNGKVRIEVGFLSGTRPLEAYSIHKDFYFVFLEYSIWNEGEKRWRKSRETFQHHQQSWMLQRLVPKFLQHYLKPNLFYNMESFLTKVSYTSWILHLITSKCSYQGNDVTAKIFLCIVRVLKAISFFKEKYYGTTMSFKDIKNNNPFSV